MLKSVIRSMVIVLALFFAVQLLASASMAAEQSTWETIKKRGSIRMAVAQGEPWWYKDPKTQEWNGFCVSAAREIAKTMGVKLDLVEIPFGNTIAALHANQIDVQFALDATPERAMAVDFIDHPLVYYALSVYVKKDNPAVSWEDLNTADTKMGVVMGTSMDRMVTEFLPKADISRYPSADEAVASYQSGRSNAFCFWQPALIMLSRKVGGGKIILPEQVKYGSTSVGIRREPDKTWRDFLNTCIRFYYNTGKLQEWWDAALKDRGVDPTQMPSIMKERW